MRTLTTLPDRTPARTGQPARCVIEAWLMQADGVSVAALGEVDGPAADWFAGARAEVAYRAGWTDSAPLGAGVEFFRGRTAAKDWTLGKGPAPTIPEMLDECRLCGTQAACPECVAGVTVL